jgi:carbamoyltransferase
VPVIVLGLIGRPDVPECHDATACLIIDGVVVAALEQERISRRRFAAGEGPQDAVRVLLNDQGLHPSDVDAVGYAWADASPDRDRQVETDIECGVLATDRLTSIVLPELAQVLGAKEIFFFDHHLCHAAQTYWFNPYPSADLLVVDGNGGAGATSLFHVTNGRFRLLDRYDTRWSLGVFYEAGGFYAGLGWDAAGKLMGLSSYGKPTGRRFMNFDATSGEFRLDPALRGVPTGGLTEARLAHQWVDIFEASAFPYFTGGGNTFDYAAFAADIQATLEDLGLALARRLRRRSGEETLLIAGGVALNAHLNRLLIHHAGYRNVASTMAPHDGGAAIGAGLLAAMLLGESISHPEQGDPLRIFLGPSVPTLAIEAALANSPTNRQGMEPDKLRTEVAAALMRGEIVAYFDGPIEMGPRALGARSLLSSPRSRATLDRINRIKGRAPWRPAALALTGDGFSGLDIEPRAVGLSEYMLCVHLVGEDVWPTVSAGVHVDGTSRAQYVPSDTEFGALLSALAAESGWPAAINTSLNLRGQPMVLTPRHALQLFDEAPDIDLLVMPPYLIRRT